jgi:hypothetical protein
MFDKEWEIYHDNIKIHGKQKNKQKTKNKKKRGKNTLTQNKTFSCLWFF